jgi:hypothetical protein
MFTLQGGQVLGTFSEKVRWKSALITTLFPNHLPYYREALPYSKSRISMKIRLMSALKKITREE